MTVRQLQGQQAEELGRSRCGANGREGESILGRLGFAILAVYIELLASTAPRPLLVTFLLSTTARLAGLSDTVNLFA